MPRHLAVLVVLLALAGCSCRDGGLVGRVGEVVVVVPSAAGEELTRDATLPLPSTPMRGTSTAAVRLRNIGSAPITLTAVARVEGSEAVTLELPAPLALQPSAETELTATFAPGQEPDPTLATAEHRAVFQLTTTGTRPGEELVTVTLVGSAVAHDCYLPGTLDFGVVLLRQRLTAPLTLRNETTLAATATVSAVGGADQAFFVAATPLSLPLGPGESAEVPIAFTPTAERGYAAEVRVRRAETCPEGVVRLVGAGSDAAVTWSPAAVEFGRLPIVVSHVERSVVFSNGTRLPVGLKNAHLEGPAWFTLVGAPPGQLAPLGQATFTLACAPDELGRRTGALVVDVLTTPMHSVRIPLACQGGGPKIRVSPLQLSFGQVPAIRGGHVVTSRRLTVSNVGTPPNPLDVGANLFLGRSGQPPLLSILPTNPGTQASELAVLVPPGYDPAVGLQAVAGRNGLDLDVRLTPATAGQKEADLVLYSNDAQVPEVRVHLVATAVEGLPACTLAVSPTQLQFGDLPRGAIADQTVQVVNTGTTPCLVSGLELAPGTDPAFTLTGAVPASVSLGAGQRVVVGVRVSVPSTAAVGDFLSGLLRFTTVEGLSLVPVGAKVKQCLLVTPNAVDFGTTRPGCRTTPRNLFVYNTCGVPVVVAGFASPAPEFPIVAMPSIPAAGLALQPGSAPVTVQVTYLPSALGAHQGSLDVVGAEGGAERRVSIPLSGNATVQGLHTDTYAQPAQARADVLFVVDDSCSMSDKQASLANNFSRFISQADLRRIDYQLAATTTDMTPLGEQGRLLVSAGNPALLTAATANVTSKFGQKVNVGTAGSGQEEPIAAATAALTEPLSTSTNLGLVRADATLAVIVVSDAVDQSPDPIAWYLDKLLQVKGPDRRWQFSFNVVGPFTNPVPTGCTYDSSADVGPRYTTLIDATQGLRADICTPDWGATLEQLGRTTLGVRSEFPLGAMPDSSQITVQVNGVAVTNWTYDGTLNAIQFTGAPPGPGTTLTVTYPATCF